MIQVEKNKEVITVTDNGEAVEDIYKHFKPKVAQRVAKTIDNLRELKIDKTVLTIK